MTPADPKYVAGQHIHVYGNTAHIQNNGTLDGGEIWYKCRLYTYDPIENKVTWGRTTNIPEEDIRLVEKCVFDFNPIQYYPGPGGTL